MNGRVRRCSLTASFGSSRFLTGDAPARLSRPEQASRSVFSLAHDDRPFPSGHYEVSVPDLLLQRLAGPSSGPFGLRLVVSTRVARRRRSQPLLPRCPDFCPFDPGLASDLCFPFGVGPLRIAFTPIATAKLTFPNNSMSVAQSVRPPRIFAPDSLLLRRLAAPQTSWNRFNFLPPGPNSQ